MTEAERLLACDAQTSGGLLLAVAPDRVDALLAGLRARATPAASVIGEIRPATERLRVVRNGPAQ